MNLVIIIFFTFIAALYDLTKRKIPNRLLILMLPSAFLWSYINHSYEGLMWSIVFFITTILILLIPFSLNAFGAGDVKLIASIAAFTKLSQFINIFFYFALFGALYALTIVVKRKFFLVSNNDNSIPYAVPIFFGVVGFFIFGEILYV